jgi:cell wall assembly regulator SMI1
MFDFAPAEGGKPGQIIAYSIDKHEAWVVADSFEQLL